MSGPPDPRPSLSENTPLEESIVEVCEWIRGSNDFFATAWPRYRDDRRRAIKQLGRWGVTPSELARRLGVTPQTVQRWSGQFDRRIKNKNIARRKNQERIDSDD